MEVSFFTTICHLVVPVTVASDEDGDVASDASGGIGNASVSPGPFAERESDSHLELTSIRLIHL